MRAEKLTSQRTIWGYAQAGSKVNLGYYVSLSSPKTVPVVIDFRLLIQQ